MTRLRGCPIAVVDVETTAADPTTARIVEIGVVVVDELGDSEPRVALSTRVKPGEPIPEDATRVHGICDADVADAPAWAEVWPQVAEILRDRTPAAYNSTFDALVLAHEIDRLGADDVDLAVTEHLRMLGWPWVDPYILARQVDQYEKGKRLSDVAERRGVLVDAHGAAGDAMVTALLIPRLLGEAGRLRRRGKPVEGRPTAADLASVEAYLEWQSRQALEQEQELVRFRGPSECPWHRLLGVPEPQAEVRPPASATCKSCGAQILWFVTRTGKRMPVDVTPLRAEPGGSCVLVLDSGEVRGSLQLDPKGSIHGRQAHWSTCPNANNHREARP